MKFTPLDYFGIASIFVLTFIGIVQILTAPLNDWVVTINYNSYDEGWIEFIWTLCLAGYIISLLAKVIVLRMFTFESRYMEDQRK